MHINHYNTVLDQFLGKRKDHLEESGRKVPVDTNQLAIGGIKVVDAPVMVFDIVNSQVSMDQLGKKKYIEWLGMALHCFFHCVDDYDGTIDKYTGVGAMVSFSLGSKEERCINAKECAVKISQILNEILNPYFTEKNYKVMNVRIRIDFGTIRIEKIGKKGQSQLIIVRGAANYAKRLEEKGKSIDFDQYTTICFGYDLLYNIPKKYISNSEGKVLYRNIDAYSGSSKWMDQNHIRYMNILEG
ncbi:MAG: hypothetical protein P8Y70_06995 [Candidatus Lokiarchaeota archaeon]